MHSVDLQRLSDTELRQLARELGLTHAAQLDREPLLQALRASLADNRPESRSVFGRARQLFRRTVDRVLGRSGPDDDKEEDKEDETRATAPVALRQAEHPHAPSTTAGRPHLTVVPRPPAASPGPTLPTSAALATPPPARTDRPAVAPMATTSSTSVSTAAAQPAPWTEQAVAPSRPAERVAEPWGMLDLEEVPHAYGVDSICLLARDPWSLFCYWELTEGRLAAARFALGETSADLVLRVTFRGDGEPSDSSTADSAAERTVDTVIQQLIGRMYLDAVPGLRANVCLGLRAPSGRFVPTIWSAFVAVPPDRPGPDGPVDWLEVEPPPLQRSPFPERIVIVRPAAPSQLAATPLPRGDVPVVTDGSSRLAERKRPEAQLSPRPPGSSWLPTSPGRWHRGG